MIKKYWAVWLVFGGAFLLRILLLNYVYHVDILSNAGWGEWIYKNGPNGFYDNKIWFYSWPTQPPLVNFIYGWCFNLYDFINTNLVGIGSFIAQHHLGANHLKFYYDF